MALQPRRVLAKCELRETRLSYERYTRCANPTRAPHVRGVERFVSRACYAGISDNFVSSTVGSMLAPTCAP